MATAPTDPKKLNQQPSSDITSSVNKFAGDVGAGAFNTARGYVDWSEKPLRDQPLTEVATGTLLGSTTPEAGWGEFYRRVEEEPGKIVGEVATEVGVNVATLGAAKAVQGTKIGAKAALQLSKAKGAVKSKVATATRGGREINKGTKKQWPVDKNIQTIQDIEKITGKSITKLNDEIDTAKKIKDNKISGWDSTKTHGNPKRTMEELRRDRDEWKQIGESTKRMDDYLTGKPGAFKRLSREEKKRVRDIDEQQRIWESSDPKFPHDPVNPSREKFILKNEQDFLKRTDLFEREASLKPGFKPSEPLNFGGFHVNANTAKKLRGGIREPWPKGSFESKITKKSDDYVLRRLAIGEERKRRRRWFNFDNDERGFQRRSELSKRTFGFDEFVAEKELTKNMKWFGKKDIIGGRWSNLTTWPRGGGIGSGRGRKMPSDYIKAQTVQPKTKKRPFFSILFPTDKPESRERRVRDNRRF